MRVARLALAGALVGACASSSPPASGGAAPGQERGACRPGGTCEAGLVCLSDLCVRPPPADCAAVATQLSYLLLDNYAPRETRDALVRELATRCEAAHLSEREGDCLVRARSRAELGACPRPLGVGDCARIAAHLEQLRARTGVDAYLVTPADRALARCKNEVASLAFEQCALGARSIDELDRCIW